MHARLSVNSICFMGTSLDQQAEFWRQLAARNVSLVGPQIAQEGVNKASELLAAGRYQLETIMQPFLPGKCLDPNKQTWQEPRDRLNRLIDTAVKLSAKSIYMTTGGHGDLSWEQAAEVFSCMIEPCVLRARSAGIALMIENSPAQYADMHIAHSLRDTVTLAEMAGIGVCIDLAGCWTEADLKATIERSMPRCDLVQVSDYVCGDRALPCRAVPGDGNMPLARLFEWLLGAGYQGSFDIELIGPRIDQEGAVNATRRAADFVGDWLDQHFLDERSTEAQ